MTEIIPSSLQCPISYHIYLVTLWSLTSITKASQLIQRAPNFSPVGSGYDKFAMNCQVLIGLQSILLKLSNYHAVN